MEEMNVANTELHEWYENLTYSDAKTILEEKLVNIKMSFIAAGYYMKYIRDMELYKEDGYQSIWEFAEVNYGIQRTTASRWMAINDKFSEGGNSPILAEQYKRFEKSQLQEMLYLDDEQLSKVTPDMTVKEIRESRKPEIQEEPLSILGYARRTYPEGSLIATAGCGTYDCFSCHQEGCEIRQEDCYCVEATCGSPFPCTTLHVVESIRQDIGNECQFVNKDLAFQRAGDGQPVPCCKECDNSCGYRCNRAMKYQQKEEKEKTCDVAQDAKSSCPPEQSSCTREHWGTTKEEQEAGEKECKKCWERYKKRNQELCATSHMEEEHGADCKKAEPEIKPVCEDVTEEMEDTLHPEPEEVIVDGEYTELPEEQNEDMDDEPEERSDMDLLKEMLEKEKKLLKDILECYSEKEHIARRQKIKVAALANMLCELEDIHEEQTQPELPRMKNNDQRKEFIENYESWKVWIDNKETGERYYRYDFDNGESFVVKVYFHKCFDYMSTAGGSYKSRYKDKYGSEEYYLMKEGRYFKDCLTNKSQLIEYLKNLQKVQKED